jgi:signal transduction histidine kinase
MRRLLLGLAGAAVGVGLTWTPTLAAVGAGIAGLALALPARIGRWVALAALLTSLPGTGIGAGFVAGAHAFGARALALRSALVWLAAYSVILLVGCLQEGSLPIPVLVLVLAFEGPALALRDREVVVARLAQRAEELKAEREAHAALSVRYERARIAGEMHDIVGHALSVMVVQAAAGQRLAARDPEATEAALRTIAQSARQAQADIGRLVALLSDEDAIGPAPDLSLVEDLVATATGSGLDITLRLEGEREGLPADVSALSYRVVQEGITNALRHAPGAPLQITVAGDRDVLRVTVRNGQPSQQSELRGAGTGSGLRGLRERVTAIGGRLDAAPEPGGGWALRAGLPRA